MLFPKSIVVAAALAACLLAMSDASAGEAEWRAQTQAGVAAFQRGDYRAAAANFSTALKEASAFGETDRRFADTLVLLGVAIRQQGRYAEAEPLFTRALVIFEKALGATHLSVGTTLDNLAEVYRAQGRYAEAEPLYRRSLSIRENALGPDRPVVAVTLNNLANLYETQGRHAEAEPLYWRSLDIIERARGPEHPDVGTALNNLARLRAAQGRYGEAELLYRRSLGIKEKALGSEHPDVAAPLSNLAQAYAAQGRYGEAEPLYRRSLAVSEKARGPGHPAVGATLSHLASLYEVQGRYPEAELYHRRALEILEKALGTEHANVGSLLNNLAALYNSQGRYAQAEPLYRRALEIYEKALGPEHPHVGSALNNLAQLYKVQGRYAEAEPLYRQALGIYEKALGPEHLSVATTLGNLAESYRAQVRYAEGEPLARRSLTIREKVLGPEHPDVGTALNNLAAFHHSDRKYPEAELLYRRALLISERTFGADHPRAVAQAVNLAGVYRLQRRWSEGLSLARRASQSLAARFSSPAESGRIAVLAEQRRWAEDFELHVSLLNGAHPGDVGAATEGLAVSQLARASDTADQVGRMAARFAGGNDARAQLARERQDAIGRLQQLDLRIVQAASRPPKDRDAATEARLRDENGAARNALAGLDERMAREFPEYAELVDPRPVPMAELQKLLAADEAMAVFLVSEAESFLWILRRDAALWERLAITRRELDVLVRKLRTLLDLGAGDPARILARPFDVATAHELYAKLFAPGEKLLGGVKNLIVVPDGALTSLPPAVLVTEKPGAEPAWLAKKYAVTVLPSVGSLRALRAFAKAQPAAEPFMGFGDPLLEGGADVRRTKVAALYSRGAVADTREVRKLARLPETADELKAIAATLKAPADRVRLGSAATERAVKDADLSRHRVIAFATHGLMAGDFQGLAEPALVLTPPEKGSELDDGLLTASEISQLKLNADWVILSACNTAAPDGTPGADGLSGLAKAFFFAGARSLLVSHWAVSSEATVALTTRIFAESEKGASKAEALQRSMLALMQTPGKPHFAHPAFWAPFVVVGEGGRQASIGR